MREIAATTRKQFSSEMKATLLIIYLLHKQNICSAQTELKDTKKAADITFGPLKEWKLYNVTY